MVLSVLNFKRCLLPIGLDVDDDNDSFIILVKTCTYVLFETLSVLLLIL